MASRWKTTSAIYHYKSIHLPQSWKCVHWKQIIWPFKWIHTINRSVVNKIMYMIEMLALTLINSAYAFSKGTILRKIKGHEESNIVKTMNCITPKIWHIVVWAIPFFLTRWHHLEDKPYDYNLSPMYKYNSAPTQCVHQYLSTKDIIV